MVNRKTRRITRKNVRKMLGWGHYQFCQRPVAKTEELGVRVIIQIMSLILQKLAAGSKNRRVRDVQVPKFHFCSY